MARKPTDQTETHNNPPPPKPGEVRAAARDPNAGPIGNRIAGNIAPGNLRPGAGKVVQRTGEPLYCGVITGYCFGYVEHANSRDAKKLSYRFAGNFLVIDGEGVAKQGAECYLPGTVTRAIKAALDLQRGSGMANPVPVSIEIWCEPVTNTPLGYAYVAYDRRQTPASDPVLRLAYEAGIIEAPAGLTAAETGSLTYDEETGEVVPRTQNAA